MMRSALNRLDAHSETTVMVGDRMDTDIISGLEAGLRTILVTTGSTRPDQIETFPYRPTRVVDSIADLVDAVQPARLNDSDVEKAPPSDVEAQRPQLLPAVVGDLVRAPRRHPDPVDRHVVDQALEGLVGLVQDDVGQRAGGRGHVMSSDGVVSSSRWTP